MTVTYFDIRAQALANCRFIFGPDAEILTTRSKDFFTTKIVAVDLDDSTWTVVYEDLQIYGSMENAIESIYEHLACTLSDQLKSSEVHFIKPKWSEVNVEDKTRQFTDLRPHFADKLTSNAERLRYGTIRDQARSSDVADKMSSGSVSSEMIIADLSINGNVMGDCGRNQGTFVMPEPAVEETHIAEGTHAAGVDEQVDEAVEEATLDAPPSDCVKTPSKNSQSKKKEKKSRRIRKVSSRDHNTEYIKKAGQEAVAVAPEFGCSVEEVLSTNGKQFIKVEMNCSKVPSTPSHDWSASDAQQLAEQRFKCGADGDWEFERSVKRGADGDWEGAVSEAGSQSCCSWEVPGAGAAAEKTFPTSCIEAFNEYHPSESGQSIGCNSFDTEESHAEPTCDIYLSIACAGETYRALTTLRESTKAGILSKARSHFKAMRTSNSEAPDFRIVSAASEDGLIDITKLGIGNWHDRLKFFAAHTKSGIPELNIVGIDLTER